MKCNMYLTCVLCAVQGEIDAHEDSFRATDEAGQALLNTGHYASDEVKEKVGLPELLDRALCL